MITAAAAAGPRHEIAPQLAKVWKPVTTRWPLNGRAAAASWSSQNGHELTV